MLSSTKVGWSIFSLFSLFSLTSLSVHAEDDARDFFALQSNSYIGASVFYNQHFLETFNRSDQSTATQSKKGKIGLGVHVGNFYGENIGIEVDYQHFTSPWIGPGQRLKTNAFGASLLSRTFLIPKVYLWLGVGLIRMATRVDCVPQFTDCSQQTGQIIHNTSPRISLGLAAVVAPHLALSVGYRAIYKGGRFPQLLVNQIRGFEVIVNYLF